MTTSSMVMLVMDTDREVNIDRSIIQNVVGLIASVTGE